MTEGEEKMGTNDKERRVYPKEFKAEAVALARKHGKPVRQVAADLGINGNMPHRWIRQAREAGATGQAPFPGHGGPRDEEDLRSALARLRKEVKAPREADEIPKKAAVIFAQEGPR
jgi:transposase